MKSIYHITVYGFILIVLNFKVCLSQDYQLDGQKQKRFIGLATSGISTELIDFLKNNDIVRINDMTTGYIDPDNDGYFDSLHVRNFLFNRFPDKEIKGICVIDWERNAMDRLRKYINNDLNFEEQAEQYELLVDYIKRLRPNLLVGIYGLPYYYSGVKGKNLNESYFTKIYPLFTKIDFISPSLYLTNINQYTINYVKKPLKIALQIGKDLNKPVIPYVGLRVYGSNSKENMDLLSLSFFKNYIRSLVDYSYNNNRISGIILFNGDHWQYSIGNERFRSYSEETFSRNLNTILHNYLYTVLSLLN